MNPRVSVQQQFASYNHGLLKFKNLHVCIIYPAFVAPRKKVTFVYVVMIIAKCIDLVVLSNMPEFVGIAFRIPPLQAVK